MTQAPDGSDSAAVTAGYPSAGGAAGTTPRPQECCHLEITVDAIKLASTARKTDYQVIKKVRTPSHQRAAYTLLGPHVVHTRHCSERSGSLPSGGLGGGCGGSGGGKRWGGGRGR